MGKLGYGGPFLRMLKKLYNESNTCLGFGGTQTENFIVEESLKQGCVLSPILFALYMSELEDKLISSGLGATFMDLKIPALLFADDIILISDNDTNLHKMIKILYKFCI